LIPVGKSVGDGVWVSVAVGLGVDVGLGVNVIVGVSVWVANRFGMSETPEQERIVNVRIARKMLSV